MAANQNNNPFIKSQLLDKITEWSKTKRSALNLFGVEHDQWAFLFGMQSQTGSCFDHKCHLWLCSNEDQAQELHELAGEFFAQDQLFYYPGLEANPYHSHIASEQNLMQRLKTLKNVFLNESKTPILIIASLDSLFLKQVEDSFFLNHQMTLAASDIISPDELAKSLFQLGYSSSTTVEEPGTFVRKGEIFDIFPVDQGPVRIHYFDDMIEAIFAIDLETQKTNKSLSYESLTLFAAPLVLTKPEFTHRLRENIQMPKPQFKQRFEQRKRILSLLQDGNLFEDAVHFLPYFFEKPKTLYDFIKIHDPFITFIDARETRSQLEQITEELRSDFEHHETQIDSDCLFSEPATLYDFTQLAEIDARFHLNIDYLNITALEDHDQLNSIDLKLEKLGQYFSKFLEPNSSKSQAAITWLKKISEDFERTGNLVFLYRHESSLKEFDRLLEFIEPTQNFLLRVQKIKFPLDNGFFYSNEKIMVLTESSLFGQKKSKVQKKTNQRVDLFAEQLATLKPGDFVIHQDHGLGEYQGLESFDFGGQPSDYLVIHYADNDKVYVPVYKLNLITKHAEQAAGLKIESLRSTKFQAIKTRARASAKKLAFDLLKLQAERQSTQAYSFSPPDEYFQEFESAFSFEETPDQHKAIENVISDMQRSYPMDHLVCGDVGFGKTEVAMRAAFKAVLDHKQVAVLVPTTILAYQHFNSFAERFKKFPVKVEFISRFKSPKEVTEIKKKSEAGEIDILIGTHKILSDTLKFKDLGLVIVDEEQRFGVGHKEKLKLMKASVDFLTLTATPIPRTLQLAFLGIRDLSLIQTAPPKRQSIKTYIIKEDDLTLQSALKKELARGGQVFVVHNRVQDMEDYVGYIRELVPEANIVFAHGQMSEKDLESRMKAFYEGKFNILVCTTIIESGIDIPNANTLIVDRADRYGLSQLHQLRGRIGRSDKKAYAYFVVPKMKTLTPEAEKRLQALQMYADIGSGFQIANSDLEIRGAGDILGPDQSGHLDAVGLELYMELLKEAIHEIKGERRLVKKDVEISTPHPAYIPHDYISDSGMRLKTYKRLSNCESAQELLALNEELTDVYGQLPQTVSNLFNILEVRISVGHIGLKSIQVAGKIIILNFEKSFLEKDEVLRNRVVEVFLSRPKIYQFSPDFKVTYQHKEEVDLNGLLLFAKDIAQQIVPC
jgi:transcription-repair coupling factor (superfamily II helicase)